MLVTGGAGFIGSHLTDRLLADGFGVNRARQPVDRSRERLPPEATFVEGDVADRALVDDVFADEAFDAVFHIAGQASIRTSFANPRSTSGRTS